MKDLIRELKTSVTSRLYRVALNTALTIPDICSAVGSENGQTNGSKYKSWFDKYVSDKYHGLVTGDDIYKIRCASLHQGKFNHDYPNYEKILFQIPNKYRGICHCNIIENALNLNIEVFISDIIDGVEQWEIEHNNNSVVIENMKKTIKLYPTGLHPYISGIPLIC